MSNIDDLVMNEEYEPIMIFGHDIRKIPCVRDSMLYGIYSCVATGLGTFMFTSRVKLSTIVGLGSYMSVTMVNFCYCRYNFVKQKYGINDMRQMIRKSTIAEDEDVEPFQEKEKKSG